MSLLLIPAVSAVDAGIHKKILKSGDTETHRIFGSRITSLISSSEEIKEIMKIVKFIKDSGLLIQVVTKTIENETK